MASAINDAAGLGCNDAKDGIATSKPAGPVYSNAKDGAETGSGTMSDTDRPEGAEGMVDIITPGKTNKTPILPSY